MHGLPRQIDLDFFLGRSIIQVCVGENDLVLNFDNNLIVSISSRVGFTGSDSDWHEYIDFRLAAPGLFAFLNKAVGSWEGSEDGTLKLRFEGDSLLAIYDDSSQFSSYIIKFGSQVIVV